MAATVTVICVNENHSEYGLPATKFWYDEDEAAEKFAYDVNDGDDKSFIATITLDAKPASDVLFVHKDGKVS